MKKRLLVAMGVIADYFRRKKNRIIYKTMGSLFIAVTFVQCESNTAKSESEQKRDTIIQTASVSKSKELAIVENSLEALKVAAPIIEQGLANKRFKDSIRASERDEFWVFELGVPFNDMDQLSATFEKIKNLENIAVFEEDGEYMLIRTGSSKDQLEISKGLFNTQLTEAGLTNIKLQIKDLTGNCGKKGHIIFNPSKKFKRKYEKMPCYTCD
jgi:hypothetical protein